MASKPKINKMITKVNLVIRTDQPDRSSIW